MFGFPFKLIVKLLVIGLLILLLGGQVFSLLVLIVISFRYGNPLPVVTILVTMLLASFMEGHTKFTRMVRKGIRWATLALVGFSTIMIFFIAYPSGYAIAVISALTVILMAGTVNDWPGLSAILQRISFIREFRDTDLFRSSLKNNLPSDVELFIMASENFSALMQLMISRPMLSLSVIVYSDFLALLLKNIDSSLTRKARELFLSWDITPVQGSSLLARSILAGPLLMDLSDLPGFIITSERESISSLIELPITGMIVSTNSGDLVVAVPREQSIGMIGHHVRASVISAALSTHSLPALVNKDVR